MTSASLVQTFNYSLSGDDLELNITPFIIPSGTQIDKYGGERSTFFETICV